MSPEEMGGAIAEEARNMARAEARELVAQFMIKHSFATGHGDTIEDLLAELGWQLFGAKPVSE